MNIKTNINNITQNLPPGCKLVAVSKTKPVSMIREAYDAGHRLFGENKVQEMVPKFEALPKDIEWHMIGHLQSNKVKYIAPFVSLIHSIDSSGLLEEVNKQAAKVKRTISCLLQVHIAEEDTKFGFSPQEVATLLQGPELPRLANISIIGLMGMATLTDDVQQIEREFRGLRALFDGLKQKTLPPNANMSELSMGMSSDFSLAVTAGSTMIRVGSAIFGERNS